MTYLLDFTLQLGAVLLIGLVAFKMRALDYGGLIVAIPIGLIIFISGGWAWFVVIVVFLLVCTVFTKFRHDWKQTLSYVQEKSGARGWPNTLCNGLIPTLASICEFYTQDNVFIAIFIGAIATSTADTLATEIGLLSKIKPRLITNLRQKVQTGTSGGITPLGELVSLAGATLIGLLAVLLYNGGGLSLRFLFIGTISGFIGSTIDSLLGSTIQGLHRCNECSELTESLRHHSKPTSKVKGLRLVDNNIVNLISAVAGAFTAAVLLQVI